MMKTTERTVLNNRFKLRVISYPLKVSGKRNAALFALVLLSEIFRKNITDCATYFYFPYPWNILFLLKTVQQFQNSTIPTVCRRRLFVQNSTEMLEFLTK